jgi:hypothetical protein
MVMSDIGILLPCFTPHLQPEKYLTQAILMDAGGLSGTQKGQQPESAKASADGHDN